MRDELIAALGPRLHDGCLTLVEWRFAHGFQTLVDATDVLYMISYAYVPGVGCGVRYDDPAFAIAWPAPVRVVSDQDRTWPDFPVR